MQVGNKHYKSIWMEEDFESVKVIDQRKLPSEFEVCELHNAEDAYEAISQNIVRGTPLIGVTAAFGIFLAGLNSPQKNWWPELKSTGEWLASSKPAILNLKQSVKMMLNGVNIAGSREGMIERLKYMALRMADLEVKKCKEIGVHGLRLIKEIFEKTGRPVNILTHCNTGWLTCVDYGTVTAPIYEAYDQGIPLHIWLDETPSGNQDSRLTSFELGEHGVRHTVVTDNSGGYLMQTGQVDLVMVGSDRITANGDAITKLGTYRLALGAKDNELPLYVTLPASNIDIHIKEGVEKKNGNRYKE